MPLVNNQIKKYNKKDKYPIVDIADISGGLHFVENIEHLNQIPEYIQTRGMQVLVGDTMRTYINEGQTNAWAMKPELTSINDAIPDDKGNLILDNFDRFKTNYLIVGQAGIQYETHGGAINNMITAGYHGDGFIIGNHENDSAIIANKNARIISTKGDKYILDVDDLAIGGLASVKVSDDHFETSWHMSFEKSCVLSELTFQVSGKSNKSLIIIYDDKGNIIGSSTSSIEYQLNNVNPLDQRSGESNITLIDEAYIIGNMPITIKVITDKGIEVGHGLSKKYGFDTADVKYHIQDIIHGSIDHNSSELKGNMGHSPKHMTSDGIQVIEQTALPVDVQWFSGRSFSDPKRVYKCELQPLLKEDFNSIAIHHFEIAVSEKNSGYGIQARVIIKSKSGKEETERFSIIEEVKGNLGDSKESAILKFETPIYLSKDETLSVSLYMIDASEFSVIVDDNDNPALMVSGTVAKESMVNSRSLNKAIGLKPSRDTEGKYLQLEYMDGTFSEKFDVSMWFD